MIMEAMVIDRVDIGLIGIVSVLLMIAVRVPIGVSLGLVSFFGIWVLTNLTAAWGIVTALPFNFVGNWSLSAIPMFLLMGFIASHSGLTSGVFDAMRLVMGRVPGGLASASVAACGMFAAASGSSVATAAAMSRIAVPEMLRSGYSPSLATGVVAASGTLGSLIPPSILMVLYGIFTEQSIGKLFIAGIIPGVLSATIYIGMITVRATVNPEIAPLADIKSTWTERLGALREIWPFPILVVGVLGGIFTGVFTPTEAGAVGATIACLLAAMRHRLTMKVIRASISETTDATASIFILAVGAVMFTRFTALSGVPEFLANVMIDASGGITMLILQIALIYVVLGMFIDGIGLMLLTLPIILPVLNTANIDLIWFGIITIKLLEIGLITPPVGLNVYIMKSALGDSVSLASIFHGTFWFLAMDVLTLFLLITFPFLTLWLPDLMFG